MKKRGNHEGTIYKHKRGGVGRSLWGTTPRLGKWSARPFTAKPGKR